MQFFSITGAEMSKIIAGQQKIASYKALWKMSNFKKFETGKVRNIFNNISELIKPKKATLVNRDTILSDTI